MLTWFEKCWERFKWYFSRHAELEKYVRLIVLSGRQPPMAKEPCQEWKQELPQIPLPSRQKAKVRD